jgi:hypothetical protein
MATRLTVKPMATARLSVHRHFIAALGTADGQSGGVAKQSPV